MNEGPAVPRPPAPQGRAAETVLPYLDRRSRAYYRVTIALVAAGFANFALLYCAQPLMPVFSVDFGVPPSVASLSLSVATATISVGLLIVGRISDALGRKVVMTTGLFIVAALTLGATFATDWTTLLVLRGLAGFAMAGVPAVGMAYLAEELHPRDLGGAMGLYIAGNAFGGLTGRVLTAVLIQASGSWRLALGTMAVLGFGAAVSFVMLLPPSRHFQPERGLTLRNLAAPLLMHLRDRRLRPLYVIGFLLMGSFVTTYNYATYRLLAPPFDLGQGLAGAVFLSYLFGGPASAWFGRIGGRYGRGRVMVVALCVMIAGLFITLPAFLPSFAVGILTFTVGFFGTYALATSWVSRIAIVARAQASALYLFFFYMGSSLVGTFGGVFWARFGWAGIVLVVGAMLCVALALAVRLARGDAPDVSGSLG
jgi:YNFM family putative membrane transporter